jgi:hypothetical protein
MGMHRSRDSPWSRPGGQLVLRLGIGQRHGWPWRDVALQPVGASLLLGVLINSWYRHRIGAVTWRGRRCGDHNVMR